MKKGAARIESSSNAAPLLLQVYLLSREPRLAAKVLIVKNGLLQISCWLLLLFLPPSSAQPFSWVLN